MTILLDSILCKFGIQVCYDDGSGDGSGGDSSSPQRYQGPGSSNADATSTGNTDSNSNITSYTPGQDYSQGNTDYSNITSYTPGQDYSPSANDYSNITSYTPGQDYSPSANDYSNITSYTPGQDYSPSANDYSNITSYTPGQDYSPSGNDYSNITGYTPGQDYSPGRTNVEGEKPEYQTEAEAAASLHSLGEGTKFGGEAAEAAGISTAELAKEAQIANGWKMANISMDGASAAEINALRKEGLAGEGAAKAEAEAAIIAAEDSSKLAKGIGQGLGVAGLGVSLGFDAKYAYDHPDAGGVAGATTGAAIDTSFYAAALAAGSIGGAPGLAVAGAVIAADFAFTYSGYKDGVVGAVSSAVNSAVATVSANPDYAINTGPPAGNSYGSTIDSWNQRLFGVQPILLDLTGHGINIAELTRSTKFLDADGTGLSHRTAWAGVGSGVLFFDPGSTGQITQKNQYVFTEWDKTAKGDLEALLNVFDSNGDGKLDASDAKFNLFKVMVSNADGTYTAKALTELGITSINLKADLTNITYADGSKITGQTTFTKSDGTTGTVANTSLATDANGYAVTTTSSTDANGTVLVTSTGLNSDGKVAFVDSSSTNADGSAITNSYDNNGDGVVDRRQVITKSTDASGNVTKLWTNANGGGIKLAAANDNSLTAERAA